MPKPLKIAIICGGPSSEHAVSLNSANMIFKNLDRKKYVATIVTIKKNGKWQFGSEKSLDIGQALTKLKKFDFAMIAMHGIFGEDGKIQALLEWVGIHYSGSGVLSSAMAMDKGASNKRYQMADMHVARYVVLKKGLNGMTNFPLPAVVKPVDGGSSVGVSIVRSKDKLRVALKEAFKSSDHVMIQQFVKGREFTCGILEKDGRAFALPPTEIIPKSSAFFDYRAKYKIGGSLEITPAQLPRQMIKKSKRWPLRLILLLDVGVCRARILSLVAALFIF